MRICHVYVVMYVIKPYLQKWRSQLKEALCIQLHWMLHAASKVKRWITRLWWNFFTRHGKGTRNDDGDSYCQILVCQIHCSKCCTCYRSWASGNDHNDVPCGAIGIEMSEIPITSEIPCLWSCLKPVIAVYTCTDKILSFAFCRRSCTDSLLASSIPTVGGC